MAQMLQQIRQRAQAEGLDLQFEVDEGQTTRRVTWVDDLALSVQKPADQVVTATASLMSIILDVMTEHGMELSFGKGKTAAMFTFRGKNAVEMKQRFEKECQDSLPVMSEHLGVV